MGDFTSFCLRYQSLARFSLWNNKPSEALIYLDTIMQYLPHTFDNNIGLLHRVYKLKADAFQQLGQLDSTILYLKKGHSKEIEFLKEENLEKVVEIDNKYNVAEKAQELEAKAREVQAEKERRNWSLAVAALVIFLLIVLGVYSIKLRKVHFLTREQAEQLKQLDAAKSRFFANVSHELRTPLTLMLGPIRMLLKENRLSDAQTKLLRMADQSGKQLHQLVNEILDLRKLEMGKMVLNLEPTELSIFFSMHTAQFESLAEQKQVALSFESKVDEETVAGIDREKCRQVLYNLLSNAFRFTPPGGQVRVSLALDDKLLQLQVADTGPGIHADDLPHVFDRFFQTNRPDKPAEGGTGVGLALCREYTRLFGGEIEVESTLGKGAVFRATFPVKVAKSTPPALVRPLPAKPGRTYAVEPAKKEPAPPTRPGDRRPTVLVVEDNPGLQDYIRLVLQDQYHIVTADNGQVALDIMRGASPDLILSDLMMPVMDGYQLLDHLKTGQATRHIPVIMLTARAEQPDRLRALRIGVDDYLTKPFDEEELKVRIENLLTNYALRKEAAAEIEPEAPNPTFSDADREWLEAFEAFVQKNLSSDILSVTMLAHEFAMSESTLLRQLKRLTGLTPKKYLIEMRLDKARHLLEEGPYASVDRVAREVGYYDVRNFSKSFAKRYGKTPSEVRSQ